MPLILFFFSPDWQKYTYKLLLTSTIPVLIIQATSGAPLRWPITIDNVQDAISNFKEDCWSTFPKGAWVSKPFHFRLHSVYAIICRHCLMHALAPDFSVTIVHADIFDLPSSGIVHDTAHTFWAPCPKTRLSACVIHAVPRSSPARDYGKFYAAQPRLTIPPGCRGACMLTAIRTDFSAARKLGTLGQFGYSHILFVCTRAKTKHKT